MGAAAAALRRIRNPEAGYKLHQWGKLAQDVQNKYDEATAAADAATTAAGAALNHEQNEKVEAAKAASLKDIAERMATKTDMAKQTEQMDRMEVAQDAQVQSLTELQQVVGQLQDTVARRDAEIAARGDDAHIRQAAAEQGAFSRLGIIHQKNGGGLESLRAEAVKATRQCLKRLPIDDDDCDLASVHFKQAERSAVGRKFTTVEWSETECHRPPRRGERSELNFSDWQR